MSYPINRLARSELWTPEIDQLLNKWKGQINNRKYGHIKLALLYIRRHYWLGIPAAVLAAFMTVGILTTFRNCNNCELPRQDPRCRNDEIIRLATGILGAISTGLTTVAMFMNYQVRGEQHKSAADACSSLYRVIDTLLLIPPDVRGDAIGELKDIHARYDDITKSNPPLPEEYNVDLTLRYEESSHRSSLPNPLQYDEPPLRIYRTPPPKPPTPAEISDGRDNEALEAVLNDDDEIDLESGVTPAIIAANLAARLQCKGLSS